MFFMGTILNLMKLWPYFIVVVLLGIICLIFPVVPIVIPILFIGILVLVVVVQQYKNRKTLLSRYDDENTNELLDKMFANNSRGYGNVTDAVNEIIKEHQNDSKQ